LVTALVKWMTLVELFEGLNHHMWLSIENIMKIA
jgi:hypothetical protein